MTVAKPSMCAAKVNPLCICLTFSQDGNDVFRQKLASLFDLRLHCFARIVEGKSHLWQHHIWGLEA